MTQAYPGQKAIRFGLALTVLSLLGLAAVYFIAIEHTPTEIRQGLAQKIFYMHAPAACLPGPAAFPRHPPLRC